MNNAEVIANTKVSPVSCIACVNFPNNCASKKCSDNKISMRSGKIPTVERSGIGRYGENKNSPNMTEDTNQRSKAVRGRYCNRAQFTNGRPINTVINTTKNRNRPFMMPKEMKATASTAGVYTPKPRSPMMCRKVATMVAVMGKRRSNTRMFAGIPRCTALRIAC